MPLRTWRSGVLVAVMGLVAALLPAPVIAQAQCDFNSVTKEMVVTADGKLPNILFVSLDNEILVDGVTCTALTGEVAKLGNVDRVNLVGSVADEAFLIDMSAAPYAPGSEEELTGQSEIEFVVNLGEGFDTLQVDGGPAENTITAGSGGINLNGDDDSDVTFAGGVDRLILRGEVGKDLVTATGDPVTGLPVVTPVVLRGGPAADVLRGGPLNDDIIGDGGHDWLVGGAGDDVFRGLWGTDTLSYAGALQPVNVDLTETTATGDDIGNDNTGLIEEVRGSSFDDTIVASRFGGKIYGGPGNDSLFGADDVDVISGGEGDDLLSGDQKRDRLEGGDGADRLTGGPYVDQLYGDNGQDRCRIDDNTDDKHSCEGRIARSITAPGRIHVIMANLKEMDPSNHDHITRDPHKDLAQKGELVNFAKRLAGELHVVPDVLLFSEAVGVSTRATAKLLSKEFGVRFGTAIAPTDLYVGNSSRRANKRNTSVVINMKTMERVTRGGYVTVKQPEGEQAKGTLATSQDEAHVLLREKASGTKVAVMSVHLLSSRKFKTKAMARHRKGVWAENLTQFFQNKYGDIPIKILGGEFNERRCMAHLETLDCDPNRRDSPSGTTPLWRAIAGDTHNYKDSVYEYNSRGEYDLWKSANKLEGKRGGKRIDFIFGKPAVYSGWHDQAYNARIFTPQYISDHRFISAVVGLREGDEPL
jgi:Ca2+-binding RTX toxin-like protein/exonuclease III